MSKRPLNIMIAENDEDDRMLVKLAFADCKLSNVVRFVENGEQLLECLNQQGACKDVKKLNGEIAFQCLNRDGICNDPAIAIRPDLILLDLDMPKMNGHEALKEIKHDERLRSIPVVIFTTSKAAQDINSTYNMGANSFITKPVTYEALVQVMNVLAEYWSEVTELPLVPR